MKNTLSQCLSVALIASVALVASSAAAQQVRVSASVPHNVALDFGETSQSQVSVVPSLFTGCRVVVSSVHPSLGNGVPFFETNSFVTTTFTGFGGLRCVVSLTNASGALVRGRNGTTCQTTITIPNGGFLTRTLRISQFLCIVSDEEQGVFLRATVF